MTQANDIELLYQCNAEQADEEAQPQSSRPCISKLPSLFVISQDSVSHCVACGKVKLSELEAVYMKIEANLKAIESKIIEFRRQQFTSKQPGENVNELDLEIPALYEDMKEFAQQTTRISLQVEQEIKGANQKTIFSHGNLKTKQREKDADEPTDGNKSLSLIKTSKFLSNVNERTISSCKALNFHTQQHKNYFPDCTIAGVKTYCIEGINPQSLNWLNYGFKMHFPANTLSSPDDHCEVSVLALIGGSFVYPEDTELVSCVYSVALSKGINEHVRVEIEHCVSLREESDCSQLIFAASDGTNHKFLKAVKGAKFCVSNGYGVVEQMHFCRRSLAIRKNRAKSRAAPYTPLASRYSGYLLCKGNAHLQNRWLLEFIVIKDIEAYGEVLRREIMSTCRCSFKFEFSPNHNGEVIKLDMSEPVPAEWDLSPECEPLYLSQSDIDIFELRNEVQCRHIDACFKEKKPKNVLQPLHYPVKLKGIQKCSIKKMYINLPPPDNQHSCLGGIQFGPSDISAVDPKELQRFVKEALISKGSRLSEFLSPVLSSFVEKMIAVHLVAPQINGPCSSVIQQFVSGLSLNNVERIKDKCCKLFQVLKEMNAEEIVDEIKEELNGKLKINMFT